MFPGLEHLLDQQADKVFFAQANILVPKVGLDEIQFTLTRGVFFPKSILVPAWRDALLDGS
jgi:hypothetical protein